MKSKHILSLALAAGMLAATTTSCDMNLEPIGTIQDKDAIQGFRDVQSFRTGFYSTMRSYGTSTFLTYPDIQCDMFNGIIINGNRLGSLANGVILSTDGDLSGWWGGIYSAIANINFFLEYAEPLLVKYQEANEEEKVKLIELYIGEAHFIRGFFYANMLNRWCVEYSPEVAQQPHTGIPVVTVYNPTSDRSTYPPRPTMQETLDFANKEIQMGLDALLKYEADPVASVGTYKKPMAEYLSSYAIKAMQARIAYWTNDYQTALAKSEEIINSRIYPLTSRDNYKKLWTEDTGSEVIFEPMMSTSELSSSIGATWISTKDTRADYIPSTKLIDMLMEAGKDKFGYYDIRYSAFIENRDLETSYGDITTPCFVKFPGNPALQTTQAKNLMNRPKIFRSSEMYLIAAEACAKLGQEAKANEYLNTFMACRVKNYKDQELSGQALLNAIHTQRALEFVGEGFRLSDLRKWKEGFDRQKGAGYQNSEVGLILVGAGLAVTYTGDDHRYTWPIPSDELQANPQMAGQQNPGY